MANEHGRTRWSRAPIAIVFAAALVTVACSGTGSSSRPTTDLTHPVGVIAFGHSGLTGEGTAGTFEPVFDNSYATGTNPEVNSVYLRLIKIRPDTEGHVANTAAGGAVASRLPDQAEQALSLVPIPALVIISTIDNDIRCDGTDAEHIPELGQDVGATLDIITKSSPNAQVLIVGQLGRPDPSFIRKLVGHDASVKAALTGAGMCDFFNPRGALVRGHFKTLTEIIDAYEAEEARVCAEYRQCHTDGGVRAAYKDKLANFAPDWAHGNIVGQATAAANIWPVVEQLMNR